MVIYPINVNFSDWAGSLLAFYYDNDLPLPMHETQWKPWAEIVSKTGSFYKAAVPSPLKYETWQAWALEVHRCMFDIEFIANYFNGEITNV